MTTLRTALFVLLIPCLCLAQAENPFTASSGPGQGTAVRSAPAPAIARSLAIRIARVQRRLHSRLSVLARHLRVSPSPGLVAALLAISFCFGVVHALGPGHGKLFTISYVLSESAGVAKGLLFGNCFALIHAGSAILLVMALYRIRSHTVFTSIESIGASVRPATCALIALIGAALLCGHIRRRRRPTHSGTAGVKKNLGNPVLMALAVGAAPCAGTVILMLFFLSLDMLWYGVLASLCMSLGMGVTISLIAVSTTMSRSGIQASLSGNTSAGNALGATLQIGGSLAIMCMGAIMFFLSLG